MLFNFRFFPFPETITEIIRQKHPEARVPLSWYRLTDGWYWLNVGETQLFRYTQAFFSCLEKPYDRLGHQRYVDYFVVELWEDLIEIFPTILEPLPEVLARRIEKLDQWNSWVANWSAWRMTNREADDKMEDEEADIAIIWWLNRCLSTSYLADGPNIWFWSDGENMHIVWDNRDRVSHGIPVWEAQIGQLVLPVEIFIAEFVTFSQDFLATMADRIIAAQEYWSPTKYAQEFLWLREEQERRTRYLDAQLRQLWTNKNTVNWQHVLASIADAERNVEFQSILKSGTSYLPDSPN